MSSIIGFSLALALGFLGARHFYSSSSVFIPSSYQGDSNLKSESKEHKNRMPKNGKSKNRLSKNSDSTKSQRSGSDFNKSESETKTKTKPQSKPYVSSQEQSLKRQIRDYILGSEYIKIWNTHPEFERKVFFNFMIQSKLNPKISYSSVIRKFVEQRPQYKALVLTAGGKKEYILLIDKEHKSKIDKMKYKELKALCVAGNGSYQGQAIKGGWKYFISNCLCVKGNQRLMAKPWVQPNLIKTTCEI